MRTTELDSTSFPEFRERVRLADAEGGTHEPRAYPGYPAIDLPRVAARRLGTSLERALVRRRCRTVLGTKAPSRRALARLLALAHGACADRDRGPTPSAGGLQALELYVVGLSPSWLEPGAWHYDRRAHRLARVSEQGGREAWREIVPSLGLLEGGALLVLLVGDGARMAHRYGERGDRFLLLEAGHLMQNLCLLAPGLGLTAVPLGGVFEREVARRLRLLDGDVVLYAGALG